MVGGTAARNIIREYRQQFGVEAHCIGFCAYTHTAACFVLYEFIAITPSLGYNKHRFLMGSRAHVQAKSIFPTNRSRSKNQVGEA